MNHIYLEVHTREHLTSLQKQGVQSQAWKAARGKASESRVEKEAPGSSFQRVLSSLRLALAK